MLSAVAREASAGTESDQIFKKEEERERRERARERERGRNQISYEGLLLTLCSLKYRPQALHTGSPLAFLRHSVVVVV